MIAVVRREKQRIRMWYHKPPELEWQPGKLREALCATGLRAMLLRDEIRITAPVTEAMLWDAPRADDPDRIEERIELRRRLREITGWRTGDFDIVIRYVVGKFIRNVQVGKDQEMPWKPREAYRQAIHDVLIEHSYVEVTPDFERRIVRQYCNDLSAIEELEEQVTQQMKRKEQFVEGGDFESAVHAREMEYDARDRVDAIVRKAATGA